MYNKSNKCNSKKYSEKRPEKCQDPCKNRYFKCSREINTKSDECENNYYVRNNYHNHTHHKYINDFYYVNDFYCNTEVIHCDKEVKHRRFDKGTKTIVDPKCKCRKPMDCCFEECCKEDFYDCFEKEDKKEDKCWKKDKDEDKCWKEDKDEDKCWKEDKKEDKYCDWDWDCDCK